MNTPWNSSKLLVLLRISDGGGRASNGEWRTTSGWLTTLLIEWRGVKKNPPSNYALLAPAQLCIHITGLRSLCCTPTRRFWFSTSHGSREESGERITLTPSMDWTGNHTDVFCLSLQSNSIQRKVSVLKPQQTHTAQVHTLQKVASILAVTSFKTRELNYRRKCLK